MANTLAAIQEDGKFGTPGLQRAITRGGLRAPCGSCSFPMPRYPGRYPKTCPHCHAPYSHAPETPPAPAEKPVGERGEEGKAIDKPLRRKIAADFAKAGLDGNGRFDDTSAVVRAVGDVLSANGLYFADATDSHFFMGPKGRRLMDLEWQNTVDPFTPMPVKGSGVYITWEDLGNGRLEAVVYLT